MKTKNNNIQTIELEQVSNTNQKNIAQINDKTIKLLPLESLDQNLLSIIIMKIQIEITPTTRTMIHEILATEIMIAEDQIIIIIETVIERIKIIQRELIERIILH
jgi:hypothetical protein